MIRVRIRTDIKLGTQVQTETHCNSFTEFMLPTDPARIYYAIPSLEHPDWYLIEISPDSRGAGLVAFHKSWLDFNVPDELDLKIASALSAEKTQPGPDKDIVTYKVRIRSDIFPGTEVATDNLLLVFYEDMRPQDPTQVYEARMISPQVYALEIALDSTRRRVAHYYKSWLDFNIEPSADKPQRKKNNEKQDWKERAKHTYNVRIRTDIPPRTIFEDDRWSDIFSIEMYPITPDTCYKAKPDETCPGWYDIEKFVDDVSCEFKYHESWLLFEGIPAPQSTQKQQPSPIFHFPDRIGSPHIDTRCIAVVTPITCTKTDQYSVILKNSNIEIPISHKGTMTFSEFERIREDLIKTWEHSTNQPSNSH